MNWFYALNGQQAGPVDDAELDRLVQVGTIDSSTLVWYSGMAQWQPYAEARRSVSAPAGSPARATVGEGQAQCSQCGNVLPADEIVRVENFNVCAQCKPMLLQRMREGVTPAGGYGLGRLNFAGFWIRFGAVFLDGIGLAIFNFLSSLLLVAILGQGNTTATILTLVLQYAVAISYETYFIGRYGATLGKMACGIQVVRPDGGRVTYGQAFGRYFAKVLSALILGIGYFMAAFDEQKRALHDQLCDTRVVVKSSSAA